MVNFCEFDKYAEKSCTCAIHGVSETLNLGDITKVNENKVPYFNMICGGSPSRILALLENRPVQFGDAEIVDMNTILCRCIIPNGIFVKNAVLIIWTRPDLLCWWNGFE